jgi:hypothetical protein
MCNGSTVYQVKNIDVPEGARAALNLSGNVLGYYPVNVLPSKTAIAPVNETFLPRVCKPSGTNMLVLSSWLNVHALSDMVSKKVGRFSVLSSLTMNVKCVQGLSTAQTLTRWFGTCTHATTIRYSLCHGSVLIHAGRSSRSKVIL